jgi:5-methylcytosine-specific restriction endonuclease McrA
LAASCEHPKPLFSTGRERRACFDCAPKAFARLTGRGELKGRRTEDRRCAARDCSIGFHQTWKTQKYCSDECRQRENNARQKEEGRQTWLKHRTRDRAQYRADRRAVSRFNFTCDQCGAAFYRKLGGKGVARMEAGAPPRFCSTECLYENKALNVQTPFCQYFAGPCRACGEPTSSRRKGPLECRPCARERRLKEGREKWLLREVEEHRRNAPTRKCPECGVLFTNMPRRDCNRICSDECGQRLKAAHRTASKIKRGDAERDRKRVIKKVDPFKVFERDGWCCRLCDTPTPKFLRGSYEPEAPELDHIVPLSRGGAHTYENTQLLCRACNGRKLDRLEHEM